MTDLDCKQTEKLIPQFLKDELDNRTEKKFLNHVDGCSSCLEELSIQFLVTTGMQRLENGDDALRGLVFDIVVISKDDGAVLRKYSGCNYASGDLEINANAVVMANAQFQAIDVTGSGG